MRKSILVPLDGSELAELVFTYVKELAGRLDMDIVLLHISSPNFSQFIPMHRAYIERMAETIQRQTEEIQKKIGIKPGDKLIKVQGKLAIGYAAEEILRYADENAVDLIAMATHGRSGLKRWIVGSVADKILRTSSLPVWLVRPETTDETPYDQWPKRTILVPLDGSELAELVLPYVKMLAKQWGTKPVDITLLRICEPPSIPSYSTPELPDVPLNWGEYIQQETAKCKQSATKYLAAIEKQLKDEGFSTNTNVLVGKAADEIVDYAKRTSFSIIVMATHGRSGLSRWVYGSITQNVLMGVADPTLLIRTQQAP